MPRRAGGRATTPGWGLILAWAGALGVLTLMLARRFRDAVGDPGNGYDLVTCFVPAARAVVEGVDPYGVACYVYPPVVAIALAPFADRPGVELWWTVGQLAMGVAAVVASVLVHRRRLPGWRTPVFVLVASVTLLWTWPVTREFQIGGTNFTLLAILAGAALATASNRSGVSGALIAAAALLKTWPAVIGLWLVRRGAHRPLRAVVIATGVGAIGLVASFVLLDPASPAAWVRSTLRLGIQPHPSYSAYGLGLELFSGGAFGEPLATSPALRWAVTGALAALVLALLVVVLRRPGDSFLALWHVTGCVLLLMPTSHIVYLTLLVPVVWARLARVLAAGAQRADVILLVVAAAWWVLAMRPWAPESIGGFLLTVVSTLAMLVASVAAEAVARPGHDVSRTGSGPRARQERAATSVVVETGG